MPHVVHSSYAYDLPSLDSSPVMMLREGQQLADGELRAGFLVINEPDLPRMYLPACMCSPFARSETPSLRFPEPMILSPKSGTSTTQQVIVQAAEQVEVLESMQKFTHIRRADGMHGFVPTLLLNPIMTIQNMRVASLKQAVRLYSLPIEGTQLSTLMIIPAHESVSVLGQSQHEMLVQTKDGHVGFLPASQYIPPAGALIPIGPLDIVWLILGFLWGGVNWYGVLTMMSWMALLVAGIGPWAMLITAFVIMLAMLTLSQHRFIVRSFAIGGFLAALLLFSQYF